MIVLDDEKKRRIVDLVKSLREIEACIEPYQEQRKELRTSYIENNWLTNDEFSLVKKAYNNSKKKIKFDDLAEISEVVEKEFGLQ
jgi:hypothetical protein